MFAAWADPTGAVTAHASTVVDRATGIQATGEGPCPDLVVTRQRGKPVVVRGRP